MEIHLISFLSRIANLLFPYRVVIYFIAFALAGMILYMLQDGSSVQQEQGIVTYLLGFVWLLLLNAMIHIFYQANTIKPATTWFARVKKRLSGFVQNIVVSVFVLISLAVIYLTFKLLNL